MKNYSLRYGGGLVLFSCLLSLLYGCSTLENSVDAKDPNKNKYDQNSGAEQGGAQFETAIWSSDPEKKTLPKALGADGKEK
jgi:hypothetical protein